MIYDPFSLEGKTVLVTGASSGIGKAIAVECSNAGASIIITGRDSLRLNETFRLLKPGNHKIILADLANSNDIQRLVDEMDLLDGVVHSAGVIKRLPLKFISESSLNELFQVNFTAPALLTQKLYKKKILNSGASVVFISSVASSFASLGNIMYMSTKGAMNSFMKGIALELASSGIRANAIQPGMVMTHLSAQISDQELQEDMKRYPLGRYGTPEDVAYAAIYLLSAASSWMTGSIITIDGGLTLR